MRESIKHAVIPLLLATGGTGAALAARPTTSAASVPPAQRTTPPPPAATAIRQRALTTRDMKSKEGLTYRIFVSAPLGPPPPGGFPVIYVLDGNAWTVLAAEITRLNEPRFGPVMVVGVGYPVDSLLDVRRRAFDMTPPGPLTVPADELAGLRTGGAAPFLAFLDDQVRPEIERNFTINRSRQTLFGHSLGGLFVLYTLFNRPSDFGCYIAGSPSIWFNGRAVLKDEKKVSGLGRDKAPRVLLTAGEYEGAMSPENEADLRQLAQAHPELLRGRSVDEALAQMRSELAEARMIEEARNLATRLSAHGMDARFVLFPGEDHNSEAPDALNRGIPFALKARS